MPGKIRFKKWTFSLLSPLIGVHIGKNPVSGQRFMHVAFLPFCGADFEIAPFGLNEQLLKKDSGDNEPSD